MMHFNYDLEKMVDILQEKKEVESFITDIFQFHLFCEDNYGVKEFLINPHLTSDSKIKHLDRYIKPYIGKCYYEFLKQLIINDDITHYQAVDKKLLAIIEKKLNCEYVEVVFSELLPDEQILNIRKHLEKISKRKIFTYNSISPRIIGGFVLNYKEKMIDLSILGDLEKVKTELMYQK
jgi:ATP synthase F1 delta subunit